MFIYSRIMRKTSKHTSGGQIIKESGYKYQHTGLLMYLFKNYVSQLEMNFSVTSTNRKYIWIILCGPVGKLWILFISHSIFIRSFKYYLYIICLENTKFRVCYNLFLSSANNIHIYAHEPLKMSFSDSGDLKTFIKILQKFDPKTMRS